MLFSNITYTGCAESAFTLGAPFTTGTLQLRKCIPIPAAMSRARAVCILCQKIQASRQHRNEFHYSIKSHKTPHHMEAAHKFQLLHATIPEDAFKGLWYAATIRATHLFAARLSKEQLKLRNALQTRQSALKFVRPLQVVRSKFSFLSHPTCNSCTHNIRLQSVKQRRSLVHSPAEFLVVHSLWTPPLRPRPPPGRFGMRRARLT